MSPTVKANKFGSSSSLFSCQDVIHESNREFLNSMIVSNTPSLTTNRVVTSTSTRFCTPNSMQRIIPMPPEITSTLHKDRGILKPIAFKPLMKKVDTIESHRYGSTPVLTKSSYQIHHYGSSNDLRRQTIRTYDLAERKLRSASPTAMSSLPFFNQRSIRNDYDDLDNVNIRKVTSSYNKEPDIYAKAFRSLERVGSTDDKTNSLIDLRSSSSDSASFAEIEVTLKEKDSELSYLRQTMEHNEEVIFNVYKEKELAHERELRKLRVLHESKMRAATQKSIKLEQMLTLRSYQFQEEQKRLKDENIKSAGEISVLRGEIEDLRTRLEETEWKLCQRTGELNHLRSELNSSQDDRRNYCQEIASLKNRINQLKSGHVMSNDTEIDFSNEIPAKNDVNDKSIQSEILKLLEQLENEVTNEETSTNKSESERMDKAGRENVINIIDKIKKKISNVIKKWHEERTSWDSEKATWMAEKDKVLCYQKRLQLNYIDMFRRNKTLESEIESLSMKLHLTSRARRKGLADDVPSSPTTIPL